jgi:hypothetical protein
VRTEVESDLAGTPLSAEATEIADGIASGLTQRVVEAVPDELRMQVIEAAQVSYAAGLEQIFIVSGIVALIGAVATVVLVHGEDLKFPTAGAGH